MKIAYKLMLSFLLLSIFIWVVCYIGNYNTQQIFKYHIRENFVNYAGNLLKAIETDVYSKIEIFQVYSKSIYLKRSITNSNREFDNFPNVQAVIDQRDQAWIRNHDPSVNPFMAQLLKSNLSKELSEKIKYLNKKYGRMLYSEIFVSNRYGAVTGLSEVTTDYRQDDENWWGVTLENNVHISPIEYDESSGANSISFCIKINDDFHHFIGILRVTMNAEVLNDIIREKLKYSEYKTAKTYLINNDAISSKGTLPENVLPLLAQSLNNPSQHSHFKETLNTDQQEIIVAWAHQDVSEFFDELPLTLVIEDKLKNIYTPLYRLSTYMFTIPLALTLFAVIIGVYISRTISSPLIALSKAVQRVGKDDQVLLTPITSNDEIGILSSAFNEMLENLNRSTISINRLNEEIDRRKDVETRLQNKTGLLTQKVKELNCLFYISNLFDNSDMSIEEIINLTLDRTIQIWESPENVCGKIVWQDAEYISDNYQPAEWNLISQFQSPADFDLKIEIGYLTPSRENTDDELKKENQRMLDAITNQLGRFIRSKVQNENSKKLERQLLQSEKMASIGQLAAGVAHEINNPTGFVSSNLTTLEDYQTDLKQLIEAYRALIIMIEESEPSSINYEMLISEIKKMRELEEDIDIDFILQDLSQLISESKQGTGRIKKIVEDLKNFAHPGTDNMTTADINEIIRSTLNIVWNELKYKAEVIENYAPLPKIECYPQQLNQVFANLLVNAAQAIPEKGQINLITQQNHDHIEIKISDTGTGIDEKNILKIFDPFFTTKAVGKGTGLGLHIVYNIIKKHDGQINVKSTPGTGTEFMITLPVKQN